MSRLQEPLLLKKRERGGLVHARLFHTNGAEFFLSPVRTPPAASIIPTAMVTVVTVPAAVTPEFPPIPAQLSPVLADFSSFPGDFRSRSPVPVKPSQVTPVTVEFAPIASQLCPVVANVSAPTAKIPSESRSAHQQG